MLAQQPLALEMLLRLYLERGTLPNRRNELFAQGVHLLASERAERWEDGTAIDVPISDLLNAAEQLACFCLLSGRDIIDLSDVPCALALGRLEIESLPADGHPLDAELIRAVGRSGLCDGDGPRRFRFAHRQFAEYLAGRRLASLPIHQSRSLLACGLSWQAGVAGPLRETAAFAAIESTAIAEWVTDYDPEVVGMSDVADDALRRRATMRLLEKFRRHELTDVQIIGDGIALAGFRYPGAEEDLRPVLRERNEGCQDILECAVKLIESWDLRSMSDDLASLVLDSTAPLEARKAAGYALATIGTLAARQKLMPLIEDCPDDLNFDLKGLALRCNWPDGVAGA